MYAFIERWWWRFNICILLKYNFKLY